MASTEISPVRSAVPAVVEAGLLPTSTGAIEYLVEGSAGPVTVVGHGLTRNIADTRTMVSEVHGRMAYLHFRGHGASRGGAQPATVADLADEMRTLANHVEASRGIAVSTSCRILVSLALAEPARFERLVLITPAPLFGAHSLDDRRAVLDHYRRAVAGDRDGLIAGITAGSARRAELDPLGITACALADDLIGKRALARSVVELAASEEPFALTDLASISAPTLVIGQPDDPLHPLQLARDLAAALPNGQLRIVDQAPGSSACRRHVRAEVADFLN